MHCFLLISKNLNFNGFEFTICLNLFISPYSSFIENLGKLNLFSSKCI